MPKTKRNLLLLALKNPLQALLGLLMLAHDKYKQTARRLRYWVEARNGD